MSLQQTEQTRKKYLSELSKRSFQEWNVKDLLSDPKIIKK